MLIGYARVSTHDQNLRLQYDALTQAGCERIFEDKISGAKAARPGLIEAMSLMGPGDTLIVWKLSRLSRSVRQLIETVQWLADKGIGLKSLQENLDTTTAAGRLFFHITAAYAQFERDNIIENTYAGLAAAKSIGKSGGRRRVLDAALQARAQALRAAYPQTPVKRLCISLNVSRATFYRALTMLCYAQHLQENP